MCDYSLAGVRNRLAAQGDELIVHRFYTGSIGLAPAEMLQQPEEPAGKTGWARWVSMLNRVWQNASGRDICAVCLPPGAQLLLCDIPERLQRELGVNATEETTFVQLSAEAQQYRDAVRFSNGCEVLLQRLAAGQRAYVLNLGEDDAREAFAPASRDMARVG